VTRTKHKHRYNPREAALDVLGAVDRGRFAEDALSGILNGAGTIDPRDAALTTELVYGTLRWRSRLDSAIDRCLNKKHHALPPALRNILRISVYQLWFLSRVPDHAVVDEAVRLTKRRVSPRMSALVNALLRRTARERAILDPAPGDDATSLGDFFSHPVWLVEQWLKRFGPTQARHALEHNNSRAPVWLRVNHVKASRQQVIHGLESAGLSFESVPGFPDALRVPAPGVPIASLQTFRDGHVAVQDFASQLIAPLLEAEAGMRVLDACAAPGGKTAHLAGLTRNSAEIVAVDRNEQRLAETTSNLARLGISGVSLHTGDAGDPSFVSRLGTFDRILVDAPCTGLGVLRHNPEAKYRLDKADLHKAASYQLRLLTSTADALRPGGMLVYSVCTVSEEETTGVLAELLTRRPRFRMVPVMDDGLRSLGLVTRDGALNTFPPPAELPMDGFFAARLYREEE
jgi:16S rRNA (cytosine967-C5)-methyltransferase